MGNILLLKFAIEKCKYVPNLFRLPKTSYIKMIDVWLLFAIFVPFAEVILHARILKIRQNIIELDAGRVFTMTNDQSSKAYLVLGNERKIR